MPEPDFSAPRARKAFLLFIPGNLPGIGLFIVFGTTAAFRKYMHEKFFVFIGWTKSLKMKRKSRRPKSICSDLPSPYIGYKSRIYALTPDLMKDLPHRPDSRINAGDDIAEELRVAEKAIVHDRNTIYVMRTLSVQRSEKHMAERMPTDSTTDSTPSLLIMRQSIDDHR